jgi:hypothetical protein
MIKNVTVSGITEINFNTDGKTPYFYASEKYCWIKNKSDAVMYVSLDESCTAGADGTALIPAGEARRMIISPENKIYISGMGDAEIDTGDRAECPFKISAKGGGSGGDSYTKAEADALFVAKSDLVFTENATAQEITNSINNIWGD